MKNYLYKNRIAINLIILLTTIFIINNKLHADDIKSEVGKYSTTIFYGGNNQLVKKEIEVLSKKNINFKAQISFDIPVKIPTNNAIPQIENILTDIKSFNKIPYYSKRTGNTTSLFKSISLLNDYTNPDGERIIIAELTISPFRPVVMKFKIIKDKDFIMFKAYNVDKVKYWILPIVDEEKMLIIFSGELDKKLFKCYGLGVADTGSFFILRRAVEDEFNGRAEAVINWFYSMLKIKLGS